MTFTFNDGDTSSVTSATISATGALSITRITLRGNNSSAASQNVTLKVTDGTNTITAVGSAEQGVFEIVFPLNFKSENMSTVTISVSKASSVTVYGGNTRADEQTLTGLAARITSSTMFNCEMVATAATLWRTSEYGYMELVNNPLTPMWEDFERDEQGYALTQMVWKLDSNNDGYPWHFGFSKLTFNNSVLIFTENSLITGQAMAFTENSLVPVKIVPMSTLK